MVSAGGDKRRWNFRRSSLLRKRCCSEAWLLASASAIMAEGYESCIMLTKKNCAYMIMME